MIGKNGQHTSNKISINTLLRGIIDLDVYLTPLSGRPRVNFGFLVVLEFDI